jgi:hypothetical protein
LVLDYLGEVLAAGPAGWAVRAATVRPVTDDGELLDRVAADVRRVADRLRSLSAARLAAPCPPYGSVADAGRAAAAALADASCALAGLEQRSLPRLGDFAVGDQVAVTGRDLLDALTAAGGDAAPGEAARAADVLADVRRRI